MNYDSITSKKNCIIAATGFLLRVGGIRHSEGPRPSQQRQILHFLKSCAYVFLSNFLSAATSRLRVCSFELDIVIVYAIRLQTADTRETTWPTTSLTEKSNDVDADSSPTTFTTPSLHFISYFERRNVTAVRHVTS